MSFRRSAVPRPLVVSVCIVTIAIVALAGSKTPPPPPAQTPMTPILPLGIAEGQGIIRPGGTQYAIALGKALFWDQQAGSQGIACAGCHFHAGADTRLTNEINPGFDDLTVGVTPGGDITAGGDTKFGSTAGSKPLGTFLGGGAGRPDHTLRASDFPGHLLLDDTNRNSALVITTNDRVSSQGAYNGTFESVRTGGKTDVCDDFIGSVFYAGKNPGQYPARQVEPRNTPSVVNAALNHRQFFDGRANNMFNGVGPFGMRDILANPANRLLMLDNSGNLDPYFLRLENGSLASQAVAPVINAVEMSCNGRTFPDVAVKLLATTPLAQQQVAATDSVLGTLDATKGKGLDPTYTYDWLIRQAFDPKWWSGAGLWSISASGPNTVVTANPAGYTQEEINFSMFWGIAIMMYESTLISNESEYDNLVASGALQIATASPIPGLPIGCQAGTPTSGSKADPLLVRGCQLFHGLPPGFFGPGVPILPAQNQGVGCLFCHGDPTFSEAQQTVQANSSPFTVFTPFLSPVTDIGVPGVRGPFNDLRDLGFANIGIRPVFTDQMSGRVDSYGNPLSYGRQYLNYLNAGATPAAAAVFLLDPFLQQAVAATTFPGGQGALAQGSPLSFTPGIGPPLIPPAPLSPVNWAKLEVDGASKIPSLRNVGLTPPYFSWGYYANLRQVMEVYNRGLSSRLVTNTNAGVAGFDAHGTACTSGDDSGSGPDGNTTYADLVAGNQLQCDTNVTGLITPLGLSDCNAPVGTVPRTLCKQNKQTTANDDLAAMVRFLISLSDTRVQCSAAPFDHPSLTVIAGQTATDTNGDGLADDITYKLPAIGAAGFKHNSGNCIPNAGDLFAPGMQTTSGGPGVSIP